MITHRVVLGLLVLSALAACNTNKQEAISSAPSTPTPPPTDIEHVRAPKVDHPLDATAFAAQPCEGLTDSQRSDLGLDDARPYREADGRSCRFRDVDDPQALVGVFFSDRSSGLTFIYRMNAGGAWTNWEPTRIDGYPAVGFGTSESPNTCSVAVGIAASRYFSTAAKVDEGTDRCTTAKSMASAVLSTIKTFS